MSKSNNTGFYIGICVSLIIGFMLMFFTAERINEISPKFGASIATLIVFLPMVVYIIIFNNLLERNKKWV